MSQPNLQDVVKQSRMAMDKAMESTRREFASIRSGKATTSLLDLVRVTAYGNEMPLNQVASVAAPEPRLLTVTPWDKSLTGAIDKALRESDLGLNPVTQSGIIRVPLPPLTEERRRELVKVVHKLAEEGKVAVRHARHTSKEQLKKVEHVSEDDHRKADHDLQKVTDDHIKHIDEMVKAKEAEIMEV
ncbi:MAG TPA: ribosome recycling factor [Gemmatimonadales bacterium]|nr:ribosome recycling factor [Gemmatimonadales bacterium]